MAAAHKAHILAGGERLFARKSSSPKAATGGLTLVLPAGSWLIFRDRGFRSGGIDEYLVVISNGVSSAMSDIFFKKLAVRQVIMPTSGHLNSSSASHMPWVAVNRLVKRDATSNGFRARCLR